MGRVLDYLEGSDPKATSGGERNSDLRDAVRRMMQQGVKAIRAQAIEDVLAALTAHELYQYRPKAFKGFIEYARTTLVSEEEARDWRSALVDVPAVESEPVAWLDDGTCRAGSDRTAHRVITDEQKRDMPSAISASFNTPLFTHPPRSLSNEGWMPIETAPRDGSAILLGHEGAAFDGWWEADGRETDTGEPGWIDGLMNNIEEYTTLHPTHWQPLPTPPLSTRKGSAGDGAATGTKGCAE